MTFTIQAQNATGIISTGGELILQSGTGCYDINKDLELNKDLNNRLSAHVKKHIIELKKNRNINFLISRLQTTINNGIGIFGGAVRDWWLGHQPKDIDIVIDTDYFKEAMECVVPSNQMHHMHNSFGGMNFTLDGVRFDVWNLRDTKAFRTGQFEANWSNLIKSVPFNVDSVLVMLSGEVHEYKFWEGLRTQKIEFINKNQSEPKFIAERALLFAKKYEYTLSRELSDFIRAQLPETDPIIKIEYRSSN